jgi:hypothetical protein
MLVFSWLPIALVGAVILIVAGVSLSVEIAERGRLARNVAATPRRRRFRPVIIQGGRIDAPGVPAAEPNVEKLAG